MNKTVKTIIEYGAIILVVILIRFYIITPVQVNGLSMESTLHDGDIMILNIIGSHIKPLNRFDIVVIKLENESVPLIKRIIGLPGESLYVENNKLYINDKVIEESFLKEKTDDFYLNSIGYSTIPKDKYFVMGDNRDNSTDSRYIGLIDKKDIIGKTNLVIYPFNHVKIVK